MFFNFAKKPQTVPVQQVSTPQTPHEESQHIPAESQRASIPVTPADGPKIRIVYIKKP